MRTKTSFGGPRVKPTHARASVLGLQRADLAPYRVGACTRCGHETTFVLDDAAGGSYSCVGCGRYA
jgi:PHP family Zn ribbon phosphoesterase